MGRVALKVFATIVGALLVFGPEESEEGGFGDPAVGTHDLNTKDTSFRVLVKAFEVVLLGHADLIDGFVVFDAFSKLKEVDVVDEALTGVYKSEASDAFEEEKELADGFSVGADVAPAMTGHRPVDVLTTESVAVFLAVTGAPAAIVMSPFENFRQVQLREMFADAFILPIKAIFLSPD